MWNVFWQWIIDNHIFYMLVAAGVFFLIFSPRITKKFKKIKAGPGGLELEAADQEIDPKLPCPYTSSRNSVIKDVERLNDKLDVLCKNDKKQEDEILCLHGKLDSICLDLSNTNKYMFKMMSEQAKQNFYDSRLPAIEQLIGGLRYVASGGNGLTKNNVKAAAKENGELYEGIIKIDPDLALE